MADIGTQLSSELTRIIECPYPASLSHLAELLARAHVLTVRACIHDRSPCEVSRLTTIVCEALSLWAYALRVLSSLCQSPEFVGTLLLQNPSLLDALLNKANSSPRDFDEYADICVLLLSRPLPRSLPLPASAQGFFLRVFEKARNSPDVSTLKPVYLMLNGACRDLLRLLPTDRRENFDQVLSHILSSNGTGQNLMLMLWCFGIVLLAEHSSETEPSHSLHSSIENTIRTPKKQWNTASGRKVFGSSEKINKMISLAYMSVIFAVKGDVSVSDGDAIEGIRIAVCALRCAHQKALKAWPTSNTLARSTFTKLPLKILRADLNPAVQLEALCFYSMVAEEGSIPNNLVSQYEQCLENVADVVNTDSLGETLLISLPSYSPQMQQTSVETVLCRILDACVLPPSSHQISNFKSLVERMTTVLSSCASMRTKVSLAVSRDEVQHKIWEIVQSKADQKKSACHTYDVLLHQDLKSATIALLLTLALTIGPTEPAMPLALTMALIGKQGQCIHTSSQCGHELSYSENSAVSLFQQRNTPYTGQHLQDWRNRLKSDLEGHGSFQRDSIIRSVAQICQDLETRCNTVEEPLLREKQRTHELTQHVANLNERIVSLEVQAADDRFHSEGLEDEKITISDERDSLISKLKHVEVEANETIRKTEEMMKQVCENFESKEVELQSTILTYNETIRTLEKETENHLSAINRSKDDLTHAEHERAALAEQVETLQHKLNDVEHNLTSEKASVRNQSEEISQLTDQKIELELRLQGTEADLDTITTRLNDVQTSHRELAQSSEDAYRVLEHKYIRDIEAAQAQAQTAREESQAKLHEAIQQGQRARMANDETRQELQHLQNLIPPLEEKIQELTETCAEQEEELEKLRELHKNMGQLIELTSKQPLPIRSAPRGQKNSVDLPVQTPRVSRDHRRRKSALQNLEDVRTASRSTRGATRAAMENMANASLTSSDPHSSPNGSTPKRSKLQPSYKASEVQPPNKPILSARSISKKLSPIKRSALRQLSPNRRHTAVGFAASQNDGERPDGMSLVRKKRGSLQGLEELDSDMEDFLAGTPLTPGNFASGTGRMPDEDAEVTATEL